MAWTKMQMATVAGVAAILAATSTAVIGAELVQAQPAGNSTPVSADIQSQANGGPLQTLYRQFLAGTSPRGFITFEREIMLQQGPPPRARGFDTYSTPVTNGPLQSTNHPGVQFFKVKSTNKSYWAFWWAGTNFIIATSTDRPLTNENDIASASRLYGHDGQSYWRLSYNSGRAYPLGATPGVSPPIYTRSVLMVIPAGGTANTPSEDQKFALTNLNSIAEECRQVVQLGFSYPMLGRPGILNSNRVVVRTGDGRAQTVQLKGSREQPDVLNYEATTNRMALYRVSMDYSTNTLTIDRLSSWGTASGISIRYKILSVRIPDEPQPESMFSPQTYLQTAGNVINEK
jgi:hypothetical protein